MDDAGEVGEGEERAGGGARAAGCCWATRNFSHLPLSLHALLAPRLLCPPTPTRPGTHRLSFPLPSPSSPFRCLDGTPSLQLRFFPWRFALTSFGCA